MHIKIEVVCLHFLVTFTLSTGSGCFIYHSVIYPSVSVVQYIDTVSLKTLVLAALFKMYLTLYIIAGIKTRVTHLELKSDLHHFLM